MEPMIDATLYHTARLRLRDLQFGDESAVLSLQPRSRPQARCPSRRAGELQAVSPQE
jgi:hypothetical protein